jgi:uncharacterized protein YciI
MPYFVFMGRDRPDHGELRSGLRPSHQAHFFAPRPDCYGVAGGPLLAEDGETMIGSLLVFEATDLSAVNRFCRDDPYVVHNLFAAVEILPWRWGLGRPESRLSGS